MLGKKEPVTVYQLLGYPKDIDERMNKTIENYSNGLYAYKNQDWGKAGSFFKAALKLTPDDGPSKAMLLRCDEYKIDPRPKDWDGAFTMKTK